MLRNVLLNADTLDIFHHDIGNPPIDKVIAHCHDSLQIIKGCRNLCLAHGTLRLFSRFGQIFLHGNIHLHIHIKCLVGNAKATSAKHLFQLIASI